MNRCFGLFMAFAAVLPLPAAPWEAAPGSFRSRNQGQGWEIQFHGRGVTVTSDKHGWSWGLELRSYGLGGTQKAVNAAVFTPQGERLECRRSPSLREWFVNSAKGLEHGFYVEKRPEGAGPLQLRLSVEGGLLAAGGGDALAFVDGAGNPQVHYSGLKAWDATGRVLPARMYGLGAELVFEVDERGAQYPLTVDPVAQQAYLKASNTEAGDLFGSAVAISGDTVIVGAPQEDSAATTVNGDQSNNLAANSGAAYVFVRSGGSWVQQAYLKASNAGAGAAFGSSVALSGDTAVVGAPGHDNGAGAAYVFVRNGSAWTQQAVLKASNAGAGDRFGSSVSVSFDTAAVGAPQEDGAADASPNSGAAYVFTRSGSTWTQQAYLKASNAGADDEFGGSVSVDADTLAVGARQEDSAATGVDGNPFDNSLDDSGAAYVFTRSGATWTQQAYLKASNTGAFDSFGQAVSISGETLAVGAHLEGSAATGVNGDQSDNSAPAAGAAYVFVRSGATWTQQAYLKASNSAAQARFGYAISISGDAALVGALLESTTAIGSGAAYLFGRAGGVWSQQGLAKASNAGLVDTFGAAVGLSGENAVIGAVGESSAATGVNGNQSNNSADSAGAAYLWQASLDGAGLRFVPVTPCRVADTRAGQGASGAFGPPSLAGNQTRVIPVTSSSCGIPASARAFALNVTVLPAEPLGYLTLWPTGQTQPLVSTLNSFHGGIVANAAIVQAGADGSVSVYVTHPTDVIVDINGYFESAAGYSFYALNPCRVADTRAGQGTSGAFGPPTPGGNSTRTFPFPSSACSVPNGAAAYSVNATVLPESVLAYLSLWPSGETQPHVSTLNSFDGAVTANAAIVKAGTSGALNAFVTNTTDLVLDINGYFAAGGGPNELKFYPVAPCRVLDTRFTSLMTANETRNVTMAGVCNLPAGARAYSLNATVAPDEPLGYLTLWPSGQARPFVSTLNSFLGRVVANAAIVPAGGNGSISAYVTNPSHLILDVNGYFR